VSFAQRLREARIAKELPQFEVAYRLGVALSTFLRWESEKIEPRVSEFVAWCRLVGEDPSEVITAVEPEPADRVAS
jgi:transcriptional regulator with XRE-family HTH domain